MGLNMEYNDIIFTAIVSPQERCDNIEESYNFNLA